MRNKRLYSTDALEIKTKLYDFVMDNIEERYMYYRTYDRAMVYEFTREIIRFFWESTDPENEEAFDVNYFDVSELVDVMYQSIVEEFYDHHIKNRIERDEM